VIVYLRGMNRSPPIEKELEHFDPARHATEGESRRRAFIPFGPGTRGCPGQQIALAELEAALPIIAKRGMIEIDGQVKEDLLFAIRVRGGLRGRDVPFEGPHDDDLVVA